MNSAFSLFYCSTPLPLRARNKRLAIMQQFDPLMKAGKHKEAGAVLKLLRSADKQEPKKSEATEL